MDLSTHLGKLDTSVVVADVLCHTSVVGPSSPPFQPGELVRPRCPGHPWRQYPIVIDKCFLIGKIWLLSVYIHTHVHTFLQIEVLAEDYERANTFHSVSSAHSQRTVGGQAA